jgi:hypothetical protein
MSVFISYSGFKGAQLAEELNRALVTRGIHTWFAQQDLAPGEPFRERLEQAIRSADDIILLIAPGGALSEWQQWEWRAAIEAVWKGKQLIPVLIGDAEIPGLVRSTVSPGQPVQVVRIADPQRDWDREVDRLAQVLTKKLTWKDVAQNFYTTEQDKARQKQWFDDLKEVAETFKTDSR